MLDGDAAGLTDKERLEQEKWQWHQLGHMQVCTSLQTDNHTSTHRSVFFTGRMPFLPPNQQCQSTEGIKLKRRKRTRKKITRVTPSKPITLML